MTTNTVTASVERLLGSIGKTSEQAATGAPGLAGTLKPVMQAMPGGLPRLSTQIGASDTLSAAIKQVLTDHGIREDEAIAMEMLTILEVGLAKKADPTLDITQI